MTYRVVTKEEWGASAVIDAYGQNIAVIHSDGKTMTPAFEPEMAQRIADLLNMDEGAALAGALTGDPPQPWGGAHDH